ncbi:MAG: hypothetical protein OTJ98_09720, partial [Dehalococcoidia bacterium]|nr:hypothetical protein [Dehalococcoidia bacterium]
CRRVDLPRLDTPENWGLVAWATVRDVAVMGDGQPGRTQTPLGITPVRVRLPRPALDRLKTLSWFFLDRDRGRPIVRFGWTISISGVIGMFGAQS